MFRRFFQIRFDEKSREITKFSTHNGHYEWLRTPHRSSKLINQLSAHDKPFIFWLTGHGLFVYMGGLIAVSRDLRNHFENLTTDFHKLKQAGLKLNLQKCNFLHTRIQFLCHVVDQKSIHTSDAKAPPVKNFSTPKNVDNVHSFLSLAGYCHAFVKGFASVASPVTRLLKKDVPFLWQDAQQQSSDALKQ